MKYSAIVAAIPFFASLAMGAALPPMPTPPPMARAVAPRQYNGNGSGYNGNNYNNNNYNNNYNNNNGNGYNSNYNDDNGDDGNDDNGDDYNGNGNNYNNNNNNNNNYNNNNNGYNNNNYDSDSAVQSALSQIVNGDNLDQQELYSFQNSNFVSSVSRGIYSFIASSYYENGNPSLTRQIPSATAQVASLLNKVTSIAAIPNPSSQSRAMSSFTRSVEASNSYMSAHPTATNYNGALSGFNSRAAAGLAGVAGAVAVFVAL